MMNDKDSAYLCYRLCQLAEMESNERLRPSKIMKPAISKSEVSDNVWKWRACYNPPGNPKGEAYQCGVEAYGDSPEEAYTAFDEAWVAKIVGK